MVLIEAEQKQQRRSGGWNTLEDEVPTYKGSQREEATAAREEKDFWQKTQEVLSVIMKGGKKVASKISLKNLTSDRKKADKYVRECWNHMARNEPEQAQKSYAKLLEVYEDMPEGEEKKKLYYEVYDIYQRISQL